MRKSDLHESSDDEGSTTSPPALDYASSQKQMLPSRVRVIAHVLWVIPVLEWTYYALVTHPRLSTLSGCAGMIEGFSFFIPAGIVAVPAELTAIALMALYRRVTIPLVLAALLNLPLTFFFLMLFMAC